MTSAIDIAGDVASSSSAMAGLILVFIGATATSFDGYQKAQQGAVRGRYVKHRHSFRRTIFGCVG